MIEVAGVPAQALDHISEASLITDLDQLIVYANAAFTDITGYTEAEILGSNCRFLQDSYTDPQAARDMRAARLDGSSYQGDVLNRRKDGSHFWNSLTILPMRDRFGRVTHYMSVQRDLSPKAQTAPFSSFGQALGDAEASSARDRRKREDQGHRQAIADGALVMYMQPFVRLRTGVPVMVECLARLRLASGEIVTAGEFMPSLGSSEVDDLFRFGIQTACDAMAAWDAEGLTLDVSVNLDPSTLRNPLCAGWVSDALARHSTPPARLVLELLETRSMDTGTQRASISSLRDLGIRLAIDDLGSGFSNLSRLSSIDFDMFKIDADILSGLYRRPLETVSLFTALIQLSLDLGRDAVVEGVEDASMAGVAAILGAGLGQGYHFARPMPIDDIAEWARDVVQTSPGDVGAVNDFATALAFHFRYRRPSAHPGALESCQLTAFLAAQDAPVEVEDWHGMLHRPLGAGTATVANIDPGGLLLAWLVEQVESVEH